MYITTSIRTIRPVDTVRASFKPKRYENNLIEQRENSRHSVPFKQPEVSKAIAHVDQPLYATEQEVTAALIAGTLKGLASTHYENAKRYQQYLKSQSKKFFRKSAATKPVIGTVFVAGYAQ